MPSSRPRTCWLHSRGRAPVRGDSRTPSSRAWLGAVRVGLLTLAPHSCAGLDQSNLGAGGNGFAHKSSPLFPQCLCCEWIGIANRLLTATPAICERSLHADATCAAEDELRQTLRSAREQLAASNARAELVERHLATETGQRAAAERALVASKAQMQELQEAQQPTEARAHKAELRIEELEAELTMLRCTDCS